MARRESVPCSAPVMVLWFVVLGTLGVYGILQRPEVLQALTPYWSVHFFIVHPGMGLAILGAVVLALYSLLGCSRRQENKTETPGYLHYSR